MHPTPGKARRGWRGGTLRGAFSSSFLGSSWFRQNDFVSSCLVIEPVETHQRVPPKERAGQAASR